MSSLLAAILFFAAVFLFIPLRVFTSGKERSLDLKQYDTKGLRGIVMFVSALRVDESLNDLLAFKILQRMSEGTNAKQKRAWLIHGGTLEAQGSSYKNTIELVSYFKNSGIKVKPLSIDDPLDINEIYQLINDIFRTQLYDMNRQEVVCDLTSGTKLMSLGITLACAGDKKLIYFPRTDADDASSYINIDTQILIKTASR